MQSVPDPDDARTWSFHILRLWQGKLDGVLRGEEAVKHLKERHGTETMCEPFRSSILGIPNDTESFTTSQMHHWITVPWDNRAGRVTLAGDAAHSMLPSTSIYKRIPLVHVN